MHGNVSSDAVAADEDFISTVFIDDSGLIISATQRHSNTILVISYYWPALFLLSFSIIGVLGNLLVCLAIATERRLQNRTNWFLFSLALADMLVSGLVIPLAVVKEFIGFWILGPALCDLWIFLDVCSCTSSIMHIVVISIDRYLAINDPLNTRTRQRKCKVLLLVLLIWSIAILLSSPMIILGAINPFNIIVDGQCLINNQFFVTYGSVVSFVIPLIIVIIMYTLTVRRLKEQIRQCQTQLAQEQLARAASLVAKPFLRRHITTRQAAAAAAAAAGISGLTSTQTQTPPISGTAMRRLRLQRQQTSLELSEESGDNTSLHQKQLTNDPNRTFDGEGESQLEELPIIPRNSSRQTSVKISPHTEYPCPKNPFCQLKCTCQQEQVQTPNNPVETVTSRKSPWNYFSSFCCCKTTISIPCLHRSSSSSKPCPKVLSTSTQSHQSLSSSTRSNFVSSHRRNWRRLTVTANASTSSRAKSSAVRNEQKAVKVLGVVFVIFVIAWFPFCIMNLLQGVCKRCSINPTILNGFVWLGYVSSTINPLVYTVFNRNFRLKFLALLQCHCSHSTAGHSYYRSHSSLHGSRAQRKNGHMSRDGRRHHILRDQQELKLAENILHE